MPSQRIILGTGLAILLIIGAASIGLDIKSQPDTASVDHALAVLEKISDMRPLLHRAESTARSFALTGDQEFATEYHHTSDAILPALDSLIETVKDSPSERRLIEETKAMVERQIAFNGELIRLRNAGDDAGIAALVSREDRAATADDCRQPRKSGCGSAQAARGQTRRIRTQRPYPAGDRPRRRGADPDPRHRAHVIQPPLATRITEVPLRHQGDQRGAGGRGRRAHRASGCRPCGAQAFGRGAAEHLSQHGGGGARP